MCWFCGEYLIPRIGITIIGIFTIILCFLSCFPVTIKDYCKRIRGCVNSCFYKKATIVPLPMALEAPYHNRTETTAVEIPTAEVIVIYE